MQIHSDFKVRYGKSTRNYKSKEKGNASINSGKTNFEVVEGTPKEFKKDKNWGYLTSNPCADLGEKFTICDKTLENFRGSNIIFVDIDGSLKFNNLREYLEVLGEDYEPTVYETSFNNLRKTWRIELEGKKNPKINVPEERMDDLVAKFHLFYFFDTTIEGDLYYRYCAWCVDQKLEEITGEAIMDKCNMVACQYLNGTHKKNENLVDYLTGCSDKIYSLSDFDVTEEGYIEFLIDIAKYSWNNFDDTKYRKIQQELYKITGKIFNLNKDLQKFEEGGELLPDDYFGEGSSIDRSLYNEDVQKVLDSWDYYKANKPAWGMETSWHKAMEKYEHIYRPNYGEWIEGMQKIQDGHFQLKYVEKIGKGGKRKALLFKYACFRRLLKPAVDRNELIINALWDIWEFIDNSEKPIGSNDLMKIVESALLKDAEWIETVYKNELSLLRYRAQKRGIQYESKEDYSKEKTFKRFDKVFVPGMSRKAFKEAIQEIGYWEISDKYYEQYRAYRVKNGLSLGDDDDIKFRIDTTLSQRKAYDKLRSEGFKCGREKFNQLYKEKMESEKIEETQEETLVFEHPFITQPIPNKEEKKEEIKPVESAPVFDHKFSFDLPTMPGMVKEEKINEEIKVEETIEEDSPVFNTGKVDFNYGMPSFLNSNLNWDQRWNGSLPKAN